MQINTMKQHKLISSSSRSVYT